MKQRDQRKGSPMFSSELVKVNEWHESDLLLIAVALTYIGAALWLSFKKA